MHNTKFGCVVLLTLCLFFNLQTTNAQYDNYVKWICNGTRTYYTSACWSSGIVPNATTDVLISSDSTTVVLVNDTSIIAEARNLVVKGGACHCPQEACQNTLIVTSQLHIYQDLTTTFTPEYNDGALVLDGVLIVDGVYHCWNTLVASGTIKGDVRLYILSSLFIAGTDTGVLTINGTLTYGNPTLYFEIGVSEYDQLIVDHLVLNFTDGVVIRTYQPVMGPETSYNLILFKSLTGLFKEVIEGIKSIAYLNGCGTDIDPPPNYKVTCTGYSSGGFSILVGDAATPGCCAIGWTGEDCNIPKCEGDGVCSGRGDCSGTYPYMPTCHCIENSGFYGTSCELYRCKNDCSGNGDCGLVEGAPTCDCRDGWFLSDCSLFSCQPDCPTNAECTIANSTSPYCNCLPGWTGTNCDIPKVSCNCNGNGYCKNNTLECTCYSNWTGSECTVGVCPSLCNGHGSCVTVSDGNHYCNCSNGWENLDCSVGKCPKNCTDRGSCDLSKTNPQCICDSPWYGAACDNMSRLSEESTKKQKSSGGFKMGYIAIIVVGGVAGIAAAVAIVIYIKKRKEEREIEETLNFENRAL